MRKHGRRTGQRKKVVSKKNKVKKRLNGGIHMGDERKEKQLECYIALTIERKLKAYSESPGHTDRHEILWHEWNHNKRWLTQLQELILPSFPSYSRHDVSHSEAVVHNIEMLLGEENIMQLSATDCFVLLHTVYIHDIGMCITHADREEILANVRFREFVEEVAGEADSDMGRYARVLLQENFKSSDPNDKKYVFRKKLDVYYAIIYLIAEHRRREHGEVSEQRMKIWINAPDKLGIGFSTIGIPSRLFYIMASCASTHTKWDFNEVLKLNQEDSGFAPLEYVHPRFIAVLLQLGDALDMDNNRFHPLTEEFLGKIPDHSTVHWNKHKAIRRLRITNEKISISADCKNQDELRVVRTECDGIEEILKNATFYWSVIRPKQSTVSLPTLDKVELLLQGRSISKDLVKAQFEIPQDKAFNLLVGNNIYTDHNFVFLRELLQNAVDATKMQYFREYQRRSKTSLTNKGRQADEKKQENDFTNLTPSDVSEVVSPLGYPIEIELAVKKKCHTIDGIEYKDITDACAKNRYSEDECEYGVLARVRDYGIGINEKDIERISQIGSSYESRKEEVKKIPKWLSPTGTFGIGLQSVFLVGTVLTAYTYALNSEPYEIHFYPRCDGKRGYINVTPRKIDENTEPFGSCFEVFVPHRKKKLHKDNPETWDGSDPFESGYDDTKAIRHSRELVKQMALYVAEMVGEPLFPIKLSIYDCETGFKFSEYYNNRFFSAFQRFEVSVYDKNHTESKGNIIEPSVAWNYDLKKNSNVYQESNGNNYRLDSKRGKLYIWNQQYSTHACVGIGRILQMRDNINLPDETSKKKEGVEIYYKGILMTTTEFKEDANLIEYMDIKDTIERKDLKLNRNGFSKRGYDYLEIVYREVIKTAREALRYYGKEGKSGVDQIEANVKHLMDELSKKEDEQVEDQLDQLILSAAGLVYFGMINQESESCCSKDSSTDDRWQKLLEMIIAKKTWKKMDSKRKSSLYNISVEKILDNNKDDGNDRLKSTIFEIIDKNNKFMIVSRRNKDHYWSRYLVRADGCHDKIKNMIRKLRSEDSAEERRGLMMQIREAIRGYETVPSDHENLYDYTEWRKQQLILKWLLENIPTMAVFSSEDGNVRINMLDVDVCGSIYFDMEMKRMLLERIREKSKQASRFTVPVISGFSILGLKEPRESTMSVKRGKLSKIGYDEMYFPLTGQELEAEMENTTKLYKKLKERIDNANKLGEKTIYKATEHLLKNDMVKADRFATMIRKYLSEPVTTGKTKIVKSYGDEVLKKFDLACEDTQHLQVWEEYLAPVVWEIRKICSDLERKNLENELARELYEKYCAAKPPFTNLEIYIQNHGRMKPSSELIRGAYRKYMYELAQAIVCSIERELWKQYEDKKESRIVARIKSAFEGHSVIE